MKLYLARHGDYALDINAGHDVLTEKGIADITAIANILKPLNISVSEIFYSSKFRAKQTAEILAQGFHCDKLPQQREGLEPDDETLPIATELAYEDNDADILLVGHLPFMNKLVNQLVTGSESKNIVSFHTGTVVCLEQIDRSYWAIMWVLIPELAAVSG